MELARTPQLARKSPAADIASGRHGETRLLDLDQASSREFRLEWQALADNTCEPNPFFEPWFMLPSLAAFASDTRLEPRLRIVAHYNAGKLAGLVPVVRSSQYYGYPIPHYSTWIHDNSFCGSPLVRSGHEERFWEAMFGRLEREARAAIFLHLPGLPTNGPLHRALTAVLAGQSRPAATVASEHRAMLASDLSAQDYLPASLSSKKRKELRRQRKRLSEEGSLTFDRCNDATGLDRWINDFLALEAAGWKGDAGSALGSAENTRGFFAATLSGAAREGKLERLALRLDGRPVAMLANFLCAPGAYSFKTAFDEDYARFSPGMLVQLENLALLDRADIAWTDSCAAEGHPMIEHLWRERRTLVSTNVALGGWLRRSMFDRLMAYETRERKPA